METTASSAVVWSFVLYTAFIVLVGIYAGRLGKRSDEDEGDLGYRRVEMRISMLLLSMLAFFVLLTFPFPGILNMLSVRTLRAVA